MTDVMNSINATLQSLGGDNSKACFELQRRFPDGSTRKASPAEQAAADCQTRIQQASQWLASLSTRQQQYEWVELQRTYGNQLYQQQQYENAIQVYLTCLPAVVPLQQNRVSGDNSHVEVDSLQEKEEGENDDDSEEDRQHRLLLYCKIMNNLAQSALQLQWYKKAETFCTMALEYYHSQPPSNDETAYQEQISKLYYRRGKARRGDHFKQAKADFERALTLSTSELEQRVIQKEIRQLHQKALQAKQNQQEQKEALQKVMTTETKKNSNECSSSKKQGLFVPSSSSQKTYSSLRAPPRKEDTVKSEPPKQDENVPSQQPVLYDYWDYYRGVVGRVALFLLHILGDDDDDERADARNKNTYIDKKLD